MSAEEGKAGMHTTESVGSGESPSGQKTSGQKTKGHLKRFWWLYAITVIIIVLIIVLCL